MRADDNLKRSFTRSDAWGGEIGGLPGMIYEATADDGSPIRRIHSFSGNEPNSFFYNHAGNTYSDLSGLSGLNTIADSRAFGQLDYNRDGWPDIVLVNANTPQLNLYRNNIGRIGSTHDRPRQPNVIAVRLVGGNHSADTKLGIACRDGYGAIVTVDMGRHRLMREHRCGDGFAAQNSRTLLIGLGESQLAHSVSVRWPSGKTQTIEK